MIQRTIRRILREDEMSHWHSDEQWKNDEEMFGPDKGWIPDEQWKKDQNWPQKGDEGGSDMAETDNIEWIKKVPSGIKLKPDQPYTIDCCELGFDENLFDKKIIELFGKPWETSLLFGGKKDRKLNYINWFDNPNIRRYQHKVLLILNFYEPGAIEGSDGMEEKSFQGGWNTCESYLKSLTALDREYIKLTPKQFLNSWIGSYPTVGQ